MEKAKKIKKKLIPILLGCLLIGGIIYLLNNQDNSSYAVKNDDSEEGVVDEEAVNVLEDDITLEVTESNDSVTFIPDNNKILKKTSYTIEQIYELIKGTEQLSTSSVSEEMEDVLSDFYNYFVSSNKFINIYQEEYDYDEYMFVTKYSKEANNDNFGLYLVNNNKCEIYKNLLNHSRDSMMETYCTSE